MADTNNGFMKLAIDLSEQGPAQLKGGPFGAVIVKNGEIIGKGCNQVTSTCDPTAHAEMVAIREACKHLNSFELTDCEIYTSCEPCPMCLGAIYWARISRIYYGNSRSDAAAIGFDDSFIYEEINKDLSERKIPIMQLESKAAAKAFDDWQTNPDKTHY